MKIIKYNVNAAEIAKMSDIYMNLVVKDVEDTEGFEAVHSARMVMVKHRTAIDKLRKGTNADAQKFIKKNNADAKELLSLMEPIESHLTSEEKKVTDEQKRLKEEAEQKARKEIEGRIAALAKYNYTAPFMEIAGLSDDEYEMILATVKDNYEFEQKRLADEEAARVAESKRLEAVAKKQKIEADRLSKLKADQEAEAERIRLEQEVAAKAQEEERKKLVAERYAIEAAKQAEIERKEREEFEKEAAEKARIKAEADAKAKVIADALREKERIDREARERVEKEKAEVEEKERQAALRPDREKLNIYAQMILDVPPPNVADERSHAICLNAKKQLTGIATKIMEQAKEL